MKTFVAAIGLLFFSGTLIANEVTSIEDNAYVRLYKEWVELDKNDLQRVQALELQAQRNYQRGQLLLQKQAISMEAFEELETKYRVMKLSTERQEMKIRESDARLSVVRSRVAAGLTDIPLCTRPSDR